MQNSVVVTAIFTPAPGQFDALHSALVEAIPAVHAEDGCELYAIHKAPDGTIVMLEKWSSRELLDAHSSGDAVRALSALVGGLMAAPPEVTFLEPLPAGTETQGQL